MELMYGDDSDEEFYDRTSKKKKKVEEKADTHDELIVKQKNTELKIQVLVKKIEEKKAEEEEKKAEEEEDLDSYMKRISKNNTSDSKSLFALQKELTELKKVTVIYSKLYVSNVMCIRIMRGSLSWWN